MNILFNKVISTLKNQLAKNFVFYSFGIISSGILSFLFIPVVIRFYSPEVYGVYSIVFNTLNVVSMFCYGWVGQSYIRFYSIHNENMNAITVKFLSYALLAGVFIFGILFFSVTQIDISVFLFFIPAFLLAGYYSFFILVCQGKQMASTMSWSELLRTFINAGMPLLLFHFLRKNHSLFVLASSLILSYLIPLLFFSRKIIYSKAITVAKSLSKVETDKIKETILNYGLPVAFFLSTSLALSVNDRFIIARLMDYKSAGDYSAVYDALYKTVVAVCSPVIMTFYPHISRKYNNGDRDGAYKSLRKAIFIEGIIFLAGFIILYFGMDILLGIIFKNNVPPGFAKISLIIYAGVFLWVMAMLMHKPLEMRQQTKYMASGVFIAFIFNVLCNYFLLKSYHNLLIPAYTTLGASVIYILYIGACIIKTR